VAVFLSVEFIFQNENMDLQQKLKSDEDAFVAERVEITQEKEHFKSLYDQAQMELTESEAIVQECLEEKKLSSKKGSFGAQLDFDLSEAIESLRKKLSAQQDVVAKFEAKVKRRDVEIKDRTQELRKQRADTANAKLQVSKITTERDGMVKRLEGLEAAAEEKESLAKELESIKFNLAKVRDVVEERDSELEAKATEVEVLKETVEQLKIYAGAFEGTKNNNTKKNGGEDKNEQDEEQGDGWDIDDDPRKCTLYINA
jgi:chromosome segregation ATPase